MSDSTVMCSGRRWLVSPHRQAIDLNLPHELDSTSGLLDGRREVDVLDGVERRQAFFIGRRNALRPEMGMLAAP
jgi:hypothetical protein